MQKENSKNSKDSKKRKGSKKDTKSPTKKTRSNWDSNNADENAEYEVSYPVNSLQSKKQNWSVLVPNAIAMANSKFYNFIPYCTYIYHMTHSYRMQIYIFV